METTETYHRDLLSLSIDASHGVNELAQRANELEDLAVRLAELARMAYSDLEGLDVGHRHLLESAERGSALRRRVREDEIARRATTLSPVTAVPDLPAT